MHINFEDNKVISVDMRLCTSLEYNIDENNDKITFDALHSV